MTKKQMLARIEQLEQRIAVLEAQNAPLRKRHPVLDLNRHLLLAGKVSPNYVRTVEMMLQ